MDDRVRILYVDDEPDLLEIAKIFLEDSGDFNVETSTSATEVLESLSVLSYDIIISDYQMPMMDGITFLKLVRERFGELPFILFTGRGREEVVIEAINNRVDFYIQKGGDPVSQFAELRHKIQQALGRRRAERLQTESESFLNSVLEQSPYPIWISDNTGMLIRLNQACKDMLRIIDEDVVGKYNIFQDNIVEEQGFMPLVRKVFDAGETARFLLEYDSSKLTGLALTYMTKRTLAVTIFPIKDILGRVTNAVIQHNDITEWKQTEMDLRESEEKFRSIFENSPYPIAINSLPDNKFLEVNKAFLDISEYTREEILGKDPMDMGFLPLTEALKLISYRVLTGKIENVPLAIRAKSGKRVHILFSTMTVTINNKPAIVTVTAEVTKLKRIEEELLQKNEELKAAYEELKSC